jgi:hypothetical protein
MGVDMTGEDLEMVVQALQKLLGNFGAGLADIFVLDLLGQLFQVLQIFTPTPALGHVLSPGQGFPYKLSGSGMDDTIGLQSSIQPVNGLGYWAYMLCHDSHCLWLM